MAAAELPLEAFYDLTRITDLAVSPDGDRVAFTATEYDQHEDESVASLFVVPTDGSREPHRLTTVAGASSPAWSPSGEELAFLAARETDVERRVGWQRDEEEDGEDADADDGSDEPDSDTGDDGNNGADDEPKPQVWTFDLVRGGDARQETDREEGVSGFDWSPDGDRFVVAARDPTDEEQEQLEQRREGGPIETTRLQHKVDGVGWTDEVTTYLFVVDRDSGETERLDDAYGGGSFQDLYGMDPTWGPDDRIAFTSCRLEHPDDTHVRDVYAIDPDGDGLERRTDGELLCTGLSWRDDGALGFVGKDPDDWVRPAAAFVHDGERVRSLTASLDRTVAQQGGVNWVADDLYALVGDESRTRLVRATDDGDDGTVERTFEAQGDDRAIAAFEVSADGSTAALAFSDPREGLDVYAVAVDDLAAADRPDSLRRLSRVNAALTDEYPMPTVRRVEWESDGWTIDGVLYHDPDVDLDADDPEPLVVAIHGGPLSYDEPVFRFAHAALTSRGYVVFRPNYRGGASRGRAFAEELYGQWGTVEVEDIVAGVDALADRGWVDPDRVFGYGFSYGGIAQGYLVTQTDLLTAAVPEHGIYDLRSAFGTDDSHNWLETEFGLPWENPDAYDDASALLEADAIDTPLLVVAGGEDWRCPPSQSEQLYVAARKQDVDAKLVVYPDEHHNIGDPDRAIDRLERLLEWYERHDPALEESGGSESKTE
ncbi:S9 family peptidase [Halopiger aswanensis]|uniref:Dipeptidyl aminopeptidase/acylaminoacyl peptidase n=1 Tax=Halopiger aswanensis TaxID=148449 RepID=A0A3R7DDV7_9EURY|nr:S9 family peptidase [Halopiger aswanensis]RKD95752.1 dipeptidyl aminopeptidase/acylaminoacyl peptidase [Halopiger aswanensis]